MTHPSKTQSYDVSRPYKNVWRKTELLPCWILQWIGALIYIIVSIVVLVYVNGSGRRRYGYSSGVLKTAANASGSVVLTFAVVTIVMNIAEAVLYARRKLNPVVVLVNACLKTAAWGAYLIIIIISSAVGSVSIVDIILSLALVITSITQLVFGAKYTHHKRKGLLGNAQGRTDEAYSNVA